MTPLRARDDLILRPMGTEWVLYDPETRDLHLLNVSAALLWSLLDGVRSVDEVIECVRTEIGEVPDPDRLRSDVEAGVERFRKAGLLT